MANGRVILVGVGPGDPELVTLKAARVLGSADLVYHPGRDRETGFAIRVVRDLIGAGVPIRAAAVEFSEAGDRYERLAAELAREAGSGQRVVFVTEGDPLLYSTASRLLDHLQVSWPETLVEIVPGVSSLTAVAAAIPASLVHGRETLVVIPACHRADELERLMESHECVVLMKVGSVFDAIVDLLRRRGWLERAVYIERASAAGQRLIADLTKVDTASISYFSCVLVRPS